MCSTGNGNWQVYWAQAKDDSHPSRQIQIRSIDEDVYRVIDETTHKDIEEVEASRVPFTLYEGSVFIHQGRSYLVFEIDGERKCAKVRPTTVDYVTANRDYTDVDPVKTIETYPAKRGVIFNGHGEGKKALNMIYYGEMRGMIKGVSARVV